MHDLYEFKRNIKIILISYFLMGFSSGWGVVQILFYQALNFFFTEISLILMIIWATTLFLITVVIQNIYLTILIMGIMWSVGTLTGIIIDSTFNENIKENRIRSSVLSIHSMFSSLTYLIILPFIGIILDKISTTNFTIYLSFFSIIIGMLKN